MGKIKDLTGKKFGRLTAMKIEHWNGNKGDRKKIWQKITYK